MGTVLASRAPDSLKPHRVETFKIVGLTVFLSDGCRNGVSHRPPSKYLNDPQFAENLQDMSVIFCCPLVMDMP
jgi:hypothetical protein